MVPAPAQAETFEEALVSAYTTNPTLQARRAYGRSVDELVPQALSNWRPSVTVQGSAYHQRQNLSPGPSTTTKPSQVGVSLQQNIFRGLRTLAQTESAEETVKAERASLTAVEQNTLFSAAQIYLVVLRDQAVVELNRNNEEVLQRQLQAVRDRFNVGELTRTDVSQAESRLAAATATRIASEGVLMGSEATYEKIVGHPPRNLVTPSPYQNLPLSMEDALEIARRSNPAVIAAEHLWQGSRADIRDQQGRLLPTIWAEVSYNIGHEISSRDIDSSAFRAGLNVTIPLYQSGLVYSQIRQAKHVAGQKRLLVDESRDATVEQLSQSWESYRSAIAQVTAYESQIRAATIALDGVRRENEVGSRTVLDVLDAEQELLLARVNLVQAQTDRAIYSYQVLTAIGGMTAENLRLNTPINDPDAHYRSVRYQWFGSDTDANADAELGVNRDIVEDVSQATGLRDVRQPERPVAD
ncbi:TolC family outer membrane protein [Phaeovibrio sulfidiphilus]|uniref:TolC family outer membrane protein n=2 Tax=Phaeovibrio sulfidiphilus TaxID=1220600 RepID=A0A8J7CNQ0_9PROT|nr:TolC family outer membrane protein [Phaeovibrio sulfidiphilus]